MESRSPLGSMSALSMAANANSLPLIAIAAGVAVTVSAAVYTYRAYKNYEEKKHRKEIEAINRLHEQYLARIVIYDFREIQGFPIIYKLADNKDVSTAESLHYNDDELESIGTTLPHGSDICLSMYREAVVNAILKLKDYYFSRTERHDITAGVISYLLNMLQTRCLNFEGYEYDIAYLHALANFVNAYASIEGRDNSQHFTRLNPVYSYLLSAKQALEKHKDKLSLEEMLGELRDSCLRENNQLIRCFARMVNKNENWNLMKHVTHDEFSQGLIRRVYVRHELKGLVIKNDNEIEVPDSIFRRWLMALSTYYLNTLDPDTTLSGEDIAAPESLFKYPDINRLKELQANRKNLTKGDQLALRLLEHDMELIKYLFSISKNFITTELQQESKKKLPRFVSITDDDRLLGRTKIMAEFATLIHQVISLQYLCSHLLKSTKLLGEIYVKNPKHCIWIFSMLEQLSKHIANSIDDTKKKFTDIQLASLNNMQLLEKELFPEEVKAILDSTSTAVTRLSLRVHAYRTKAHKGLNPNAPSMASVKHEMFEVASTISKLYHIGQAPDEKLDADSIDEPVVSAESSNTPELHSTAAVMAVIGKTVAPLVDSELPVKSADQGKTNELAAVLANINQTINVIERYDQPRDANDKAAQHFALEVNAYQVIRNNLSVLEYKIETMSNENNMSAARHAKLIKIQTLAITLAQQTLDFLQLSHQQRLLTSVKFSQSIHSQLQDINNNFVDEHSNKLMKVMASIFKFGLFSTDTRRKVQRFDRACQHLVEITAHMRETQLNKVSLPA